MTPTDHPMTMNGQEEQRVRASPADAGPGYSAEPEPVPVSAASAVSIPDAKGVSPEKVSMRWFAWLLDTALEHAVNVHGIEARGVAWTVSKEFQRNLPTGYALLYAEEGMSVPPAQNTDHQP